LTDLEAAKAALEEADRWIQRAKYHLGIGQVKDAKPGEQAIHPS
jgi:hypothetical protein